MTHADIRLALWWSGTGLEMYLVAIIRLRGVFGVLPVFSAYLCFILGKSLVLWLVHLQGVGAWYFLGYWVGETIAFTLGFLVIVELFSRLLQAYPALASFCRTVLVAVLLTLVISAAVLARLDASSWANMFVLLERSVRYVQVGLILCFFALASYFRLPVHPWQRGIALGYAFYAAAELANYALFRYVGFRYQMIASFSTAVAYIIALFLWAFYFTVPVREPATQPVPPAPELAALEAEIRRRMGEVNRALWGVLRGS